MRSQPFSHQIVGGLFSLMLLAALPVHAQTPVPIVEGGNSGAVKESEHDYRCATNEMLIAREHKGDEVAPTTYYCGIARKNGDVQVDAVTASAKMSESSGAAFKCADGQVMAGRGHEGDEHGNTWYYCGTPKDTSDAALKVVHDTQWIEIDREDQGGKVQCPSNKVMVGRQHMGDESGPTKYLCASLF